MRHPLHDAALRLQCLFGLDPEAAQRAVGEVLDCFDRDVDAYVAERHAQLSQQGLPGREIYARIQDELGRLRFRAPVMSERQIRRRVYG